MPPPRSGAVPRVLYDGGLAWMIFPIFVSGGSLATLFLQHRVDIGMRDEDWEKLVAPSVEGISCLQLRLLVRRSVLPVHGDGRSAHHASVGRTLQAEALLVDCLYGRVFVRVACHSVVLHLLRLVSSAEAFDGRLVGLRQQRQARIQRREGALVFVWRPGKHLLSRDICSDAIERQG